MLKHELIKAVSTQTGQSQDTVRLVLDSVRANILTAIRHGQDAFVFGLGKLSVNSRPAKVARNLHTGESVTVPPRKVAVFRASSALSDAAKGE